VANEAEVGRVLTLLMEGDGFLQVRQRFIPDFPPA
jgi:hypothetical protein